MKEIGVKLLLIGWPLLGAIFLLWGGISIWQDIQASPNWPSVDGRIMDSEIRVGERKRRKDLDYPFISYRFTVDKIEYKSSQIKIKTEVMKATNVRRDSLSTSQQKKYLSLLRIYDLRFTIRRAKFVNRKFSKREILLKKKF